MNFIPHGRRPVVKRPPRTENIRDTQLFLNPRFEVVPPYRGPLVETLRVVWFLFRAILPYAAAVFAIWLFAVCWLAGGRYP